MKIAVLGAGAWGTALAVHAAQRHDVVLWSRNAQVLESLRTTGTNQRYLPDVKVPSSMGFTDRLDEAVRDADLLVMATSVAGLEPVAQAVQALQPGDGSALPGVVCLAKGLQASTGRLPHQVLGDALPGRAVGCLSGPSFAQEVAAGLPVALTAASMDEALSHRMVQAFHHGAMRAYRSADLVGVEIGGALKNIMAVATGTCDGLGLGLNARSALLTRGLAEITRFGMAQGAQAETFLGLAGVGDLVLTCTGDLSRNRRVGLLLAKGQSLADILATLGHVAEGVACCPAVVARPGVVDVTDGQLQSRDLPPVGEVGDAERPGVGHAVRGCQPQRGVVAQGFHVLVEGGPGDHLGGQPGGVEVVEGLVGDQQLRSAHPVGEPFGLVVGEPVRHHHRVAGLPFPFHQTGADEDLPGLFGMVGRVVRAAPGDDRHPEQGDGLAGGDRGASG